MEIVTGRIQDGETVLVDGIEVGIEINTIRRPKSWCGRFRLDGPTLLDTGGPYRLIADDGREGEIVVTQISCGSHRPTEVEFQGSGPFA